jgi:predicted 3-demethylubiquinone-9 3-methyltransferase (glyoxalase superfamily)
MRSITTYQWLAAAALSTSLFPDGRSIETSCHTAAGLGPEGSVLTMTLTIGGSRFVGLEGGLQFSFSEAVSFQIERATQDEVDVDCDPDRVTDAGRARVWGWLRDCFCVSWQIVPAVLPRLLGGDERARAGRVMLG